MNTFQQLSVFFSYYTNYWKTLLFVSPFFFFFNFHLYELICRNATLQYNTYKVVENQLRFADRIASRTSSVYLRYNTHTHTRIIYTRSAERARRPHSILSVNLAGKPVYHLSLSFFFSFLFLYSFSS